MSINEVKQHKGKMVMSRDGGNKTIHLNMHKIFTKRELNKLSIRLKISQIIPNINELYQSLKIKKFTPNCIQTNDNKEFLFYYNYHLYVLFDNILYDSGDRGEPSISHDDKLFPYNYLNRLMPIAYIDIDNGKCILNADTGDFENLCGIKQFQNYPQISFSCVAKLFDKTLRDKDQINMLHVKKHIHKLNILQLVDYNCEQIKQLTDADRKLINRKKHNNIIAQAGYSLILRENRYIFHQAPTVVFKIHIGNYRYILQNQLELDKYISQQDLFIIFGQDEGTYFVSAFIPDIQITSVADAFVALIPTEIRNRKDIRRQGEWFIVPVEEHEVPTIQESMCLANNIKLPIVNKNSNFHSINSDSYDCQEIIISRENNKIYAKNAYLEHDEHATVEIKDWATFMHNTEVFSFSMHGVD